MVATSVCARGLDIKHIKVVINYMCPNHSEDYVHRVGRTGRAGNKGTAYTFITHDECLYAADLIRALENSGNPVPDDLRKLDEEYQQKVLDGELERKKGNIGF
jgi:ATP-dependent RNA helicase DDX46/PRP5